MVFLYSYLHMEVFKNLTKGFKDYPHSLKRIHLSIPNSSSLPLYSMKLILCFLLSYHVLSHFLSTSPFPGIWIFLPLSFPISSPSPWASGHCQTCWRPSQGSREERNPPQQAPLASPSPQMVSAGSCPGQQGGKEVAIVRRGKCFCDLKICPGDVCHLY